MKLYVIMMNVRNPPEMFWTGITVPSHTHLLQPSRNIAFNKLNTAPGVSSRMLIITVAITYQLSNHAHGQEWFPAKVIAPAANVEREENRNKMLSPGLDSVEAHHLLLHPATLTNQS